MWQFFACHDSFAVVACAKLWHDLSRIFTPNNMHFYEIWIMSSYMVREMGYCCLYSWVTCQNMSRLHLYAMKVCKHIWNTKTVIKYRGNFYWTCAFKVCKHIYKVLYSTIQKLKIFAIIITHGSANRRQVVNPWHQTLQGQLMQHLGNIYAEYL